MVYVPTISKQQEQLDGHCACQLWQCPKLLELAPSSEELPAGGFTVALSLR